MGYRGLALFSAVITFLAPSLARAQSGIAARYPGDQNIGSDPDVILFDDFESYTGVNQMVGKWTSLDGVVRMRIATEAGLHFAGQKGLEMTLPVSTNEQVNALHKTINPQQDTVYIRTYCKWDAGYSATGNNHNGIRLSAHYPGAGVKPPTDGSGFFLFLLQNSNENRPGDTDPGYSHLYAYWPKQRSDYGDHWYPDGSILPNSSVFGFPAAQYPDFKPLPNFVPQRDRWYCYELMVKANDIGLNNGEVKVWIDGKVAADFQNLFLRSLSSIKIDEALVNLHAGQSTRRTKKWYDNTVIAKQYIGPMAGGAPTPTPTATAFLYLNNTTSMGSALAPTLPANWRVVGVADFNGDGKPDYLLYNVSTGQTAVWYLNNNVFIGGAFGPTLPANWKVVGVADFNGDNKPDYLLFNSSTRQTAIWYLSGPTFVAGAFGPTIVSGYTLIGAADFDRDGKPDYALYNSAMQRTAVWYLNNNAFTSSAFGPSLPANWSLIAP